MKKLFVAMLALVLVGLIAITAMLATGVVDRDRLKSLIAKIQDRMQERSKPTRTGCNDKAVPRESHPPEPGRFAPRKGSAEVKAVRDSDACPVRAHRFDIPVTIDDGSNKVKRSPAVTGFMVPFAHDTFLHSTNGLIVRDDSGRVLPAQFEVLSRWDGRPDECAAPIRHAFVNVLATPPAGTRATWHVQHRPNVSMPGETVKIDETNERWVLDTGVARFTIHRHPFEGLSKVEIGERLIMRSGGGFVINHEGWQTTGATKPWHVGLERWGPRVVTLVARGYYAGEKSKRDLGYTIRMTFTAGSGTVRVEHTYYHGAVLGYGANQVDNTTRVARARWRIPLRRVKTLHVRADTKVHAFKPDAPVRVEQDKRDDQNLNLRYVVNAAGELKEDGGRARHPFLAAAGNDFTVIATIARMADREPQALTWDAESRVLDVEFTSAPIVVGGARGIWSVAAVDFGAATRDVATKANALQLHAERPLLGAVQPSYGNTTATIGPYATTASGRFERYFQRLDELHNNTRDYYETYRVTGLQIWPDLPRTACLPDDPCAKPEFLYDGGDNNYWNWSKVGFDEFFRTGNNDRIYDFALGEAITFAETLAVRPDHDKLTTSGVTGLAPCYGDSFGFGQIKREGLNNRVDNCPGDYSYNKHLRYAYLATGDRRFADFFEEAAAAAVDSFAFPPEIETVEYAEVTVGRLAEQRFENVVNGAEFARDRRTANAMRKALRSYADLMLNQTLLDGHMCDTSGTGLNSVCDLGTCESTQAWMVPTPYSALIRSARILNHGRLSEWVSAYAKRAVEQHTVVDAEGRPDITKREANSVHNAKNGWRTLYSCTAGPGGIDSETCKKATDLEAEGFFYDNGMLAFLNVFGLSLAADPSDPNGVCDWLPNMWATHFDTLNAHALNDLTWGKASGQALAFSAEAVGALTACR